MRTPGDIIKEFDNISYVGAVIPKMENGIVHVYKRDRLSICWARDIVPELEGADCWVVSFMVRTSKGVRIPCVHHDVRDALIEEYGDPDHVLIHSGTIYYCFIIDKERRKA